MTPRPELPRRLSLAAWMAIVPAVERLRRTGPPESLAGAARALEACPELPGSRDAAAAVWRLERSARAQLAGLRAIGIEFDFETGFARLPTGGRRGPPQALLTRLIGAAFDDMDLRPSGHWWTPETYRAVRERLALFLDPAEIADIPDSTIRGAIERTRRR